MPPKEVATMVFKENSSALHSVQKFSIIHLAFIGFSQVTINDDNHHLFHDFGFNDKSYSARNEYAFMLATESRATTTFFALGLIFHFQFHISFAFWC